MGDDRQTWRSRRDRSEKDRQVRDPGRLHDQDEEKASDQGGEEDDLRAGDTRKGKASKDGCEGIPSVGLEEEHLMGHGAALCRPAPSFTRREASRGVGWGWASSSKALGSVRPTGLCTYMFAESFAY